MRSSTPAATRKRIKSELGAGGLKAQQAKGELRAALHDYYNPKPRPIRIDVNTAVVILDMSQESVEDKKQLLGHDPSKIPSERYDYDKVCDEARRRPANLGMRCTVLVMVNGKAQQVVGTLVQTNSFSTLQDDLNAGARFKVMPIEKALLLPWRDKGDHRIWADAYVRVMKRLLSEAIEQRG